MPTDKPLDPEREKHIRDYANGSNTVPHTHVMELLWEIDRLRTEADNAGRDALNAMADEIQRGGVTYHQAAIDLIMAISPDALVAWTQLVVAAHMRDRATPPCF